MNKTSKEILKTISANSLEFFLGTLFLLVGVLVFYTKIFGVRGGSYTEGWLAQISGAIFMSFGCYRILRAIRKMLKGQK